MNKIWEDIDLHTPIEYLETIDDAHIYVMRDDKIPYSYGGNKVRIAVELYADMYVHSHDCQESIITYGSVDSNLCRVISQMASDADVPCYILTSGQNEEGSIHANSILADRYHPIRRYTDKQHVRENIETIMEEIRSEGRSPYYVYGDATGHGHEDVLSRAYDKAYDQIDEYQRAEHIVWSSIYVACGTGSTMQGLIKGRDRLATKQDALAPAICGISIARTHEHTPAYLNPRYADKITDDYLDGGYGQSNGDVGKTIHRIYDTYKMELDPIYTGKAYYGMCEEIKRYHITGDVLFVHTGGYPIFCDYMGITEL